MKVSEYWKKYIKMNVKSNISDVERILLNYIEEEKVDYLLLSDFFQKNCMNQKEIHKYLGEIKYFKILTISYIKKDNRYYIILKKVNPRRSQI